MRAAIDGQSLHANYSTTQKYCRFQPHAIAHHPSIIYHILQSLRISVYTSYIPAPSFSLRIYNRHPHIPRNKPRQFNYLSFQPVPLPVRLNSLSLACRYSTHGLSKSPDIWILAATTDKLNGSLIRGFESTLSRKKGREKAVLKLSCLQKLLI